MKLNNVDIKHHENSEKSTTIPLLHINTHEHIHTNHK